MTPVFSGRTKLAISLAKYGFARSVYRFLCHFLARPKKWRKKGAKGPNALWIPAVRKGRGASLCSSFRKNRQLQLLRWRFKEKRQHESCTQARKQKLLPSATHPSSTNFLTKTISLPSPAARGDCRRATYKQCICFSREAR